MRPTLTDGQIWAAAFANAAGYPILDGADEYGHGDKVPDNWLDDGANQIKAQFYNWKNRIKITEVSGLSVSYTSAVALLTNGNSVAISAGSITLPNNTSGRIFINDSGAVVQGTNFPQLCVPLAYFETSGGAITTLNDLRYQAVEQVTPVNISATSIFSIGDIKESARSTPETGWLLCNGASYAIAAYPLLHAAIGTVYNNPGDPLGTFRVPDCRQRVTIGAGTDGVLTDRPLGTKTGAETVTITVAQMPSHGHSATQATHVHAITNSPHSHGVNDPGHTHAFSPFPHNHQVNDPGHEHSVAVQSADGTGVNVADSIGGSVQSISIGAALRNFTQISLNNASQGGVVGLSGVSVSLQPSTVASTTQSVAPAITVQNQGSGSPAPIMQPSITLNKFIRAL